MVDADESGDDADCGAVAEEIVRAIRDQPEAPFAEVVRRYAHVLCDGKKAGVVAAHISALTGGSPDGEQSLRQMLQLIATSGPAALVPETEVNLADSAVWNTVDLAASSSESAAATDAPAAYPREVGDDNERFAGTANDNAAAGVSGRSLRSAEALGVLIDDLPSQLAQFVKLPVPSGLLALDLINETLRVVDAAVPVGVIRTANDLVDMTVDFGHNTIPPIPPQIRRAKGQIGEQIARLSPLQLQRAAVELGVQNYAIERGVHITARREQDQVSRQADELLASIDFDQQGLPIIDDDVQADDHAAYESIVNAALNQLRTDRPADWDRITVESLRCAVALHLAKIGDAFLRTSEDAVVPLGSPGMTFHGGAVSTFDEMTVWRADVEMADSEDGSDVICGYVEFLILKLGSESIPDMLDSWSESAEMFAGLFDGNEVADEVSAQFDGELFNRVLIITDMFIAEPVRGHCLGVWAVSEIAEHMASPNETLVLLYPFWIIKRSSDFEELAAVEALTKYWSRCGLVPIDAHPRFLGQSTSYTHLPSARSELAQLRDLRLAIPADQVHELTASPQRTLIPR